MLYNTQWERPEVKTEEEWRNVLQQAADVISHCGWVRDQLGNENIGYCALGAVEAVTDHYDSALLGCEAVHHFSKYLQDHNESPSGDVADWNDHTRRSKRQVVEALRAAAAQ